MAPPRRKKKNVKNSVSSLSLVVSISNEIHVRVVNYDKFILQTSSSTNTFSSTALASPASTIESLTREFEHSLDCLPSTKQDKQPFESKSSSLRSGRSLDIREATRGQFVVKPQDPDNAKAVDGTKEESDGCKSGQLPVASPSNKRGNSPRGSINRSSVGHYSLGPHRLDFCLNVVLEGSIIVFSGNSMWFYFDSNCC